MTALPPASQPPHRWPRASVVFAITVAVLLGVIAGFIWSGHEVYESVTEGDGVAVIDHPVLDAMVGLRSPAVTTVMVVLTELAGRIGIPVLAVVILALLTWRRRDWTPVAVILAAMLGSLALTVVGKAAIGRVRPPQALALPPFETSASFPSGHTLNATALGVITVYLVLITARSRWARVLGIVLAVVLPLAVGLSRVYLGAHWLTDVVVGWLVGVAWAMSVVLAHHVWLRLRRPAAPLPPPGRRPS